LAVFTLVIAQATWSQEVTANITGTITDPSGAPISGATATATDIQRGTSFSGRTNDAGVYNISRIPIGQYKVTVKQAGFETVTHPPINLDLNQTARMDFQLKVGQVTEVVEVNSAAPLLQTDSTEVSTVIDSQTQVSLPLGTRNYLALTLLAPGATTPNPASFNSAGLITSSGRPYINGNREQANEMLLDGIDASESSNNEVGYTPSPDAIEQFNVITQNASAEFGSYQGGVISTSIKSGTNNYHGSAFEFYRDGNFNANSWQNGLTKGTCGGSLPACDPATSEPDGVVRKPGLVWNQFGAAVGGPIIKNKLFFFVDYQGQRFDTPPSGANVFVLTAAERAGDFGVLCTGAGGAFVGGICTGGTSAVQLKNPSTGANVPNNNLAAAGLTENSVTKALFATIPQGNAAGNLAALNGQQINNDQGDLKIDYSISEKDHTYARWSQGHIRNPFTSTFALSSIGPQEQPIRNLATQWVHSFNNNLLNEVRFGFNAVDFDNPSNVAGNVGKLAEQIGITGGNAFLPGLPNLTAGTAFNIGSAGLFQNFHTTTGQIGDSLSLIHDRHQFKFGFQYERIRLDNTYSGNGGELGQITFNSLTNSPLADLWLGNVASVSRGAIPPQFGRRGSVFGIFGQDDWRITPTITLNLGLRWEDHTPFYEVQNREVNFAGGGLVAGGLQIEQNHQALYNNYLGIGDLLPRLGLSWAPAALQGKTVIRAGYAISEYTEGGGVNQQMTANFPFTAAQYQATFSNAVGNFANVFANAQVTQPCPNITVACYKGVGTIHLFDPNFRPAMTQQWNLTVQHQLDNATTAQLGYVGQHGTHLLNLMQYTQVPLLDSTGKIITQPGIVGTPGKTPAFLTGNPTLLGEITNANGNASNGSQRYDALQAVLRHRMSSGLDAQVAYTYSKCMSDSGGYYGSWGGQTSHGQVGWTTLYNPRLDWGPCFYDQTHVLSSYATYQLPFGHGKKLGNNLNTVADTILGHWEIGGTMSFHSGNAMSDFNGWGAPDPSNTNGAANQFGGSRSNCSGPVKYVKKFVPTAVSGGNATPGYIQWFDPSTFSPAAANSFGTCSQGNIRGPRYTDLDLSLHKDFPVSENKRFEFRAEAYNALNHPILLAPDLSVTDAGARGFGAITGSQGSRQFQLGLKFYF
jgi:hypothetical protein